jgi:hypothetical protein
LIEEFRKQRREELRKNLDAVREIRKSEDLDFYTNAVRRQEMRASIGDLSPASMVADEISIDLYSSGSKILCP